MKEVCILRHANWNLVDNQLTDEGRQRCNTLKPALGSFALVISSPFGRTRQTAELLSGEASTVDERAGVLKSPPGFSEKITELRKTHPFGVAGAIISIPELRAPLRAQGEAFKELISETLSKLNDSERALIVSHDGTMVALEKVLNNASFDEIDRTYGELEGFRVNEGMELLPL